MAASSHFSFCLYGAPLVGKTRLMEQICSQYDSSKLNSDTNRSKFLFKEAFEMPDDGRVVDITMQINPCDTFTSDGGILLYDVTNIYSLPNVTLIKAQELWQRPLVIIANITNCDYLARQISRQQGEAICKELHIPYREHDLNHPKDALRLWRTCIEEAQKRPRYNTRSSVTH